MNLVQQLQLMCLRPECGHRWTPRVSHPEACPRCKSRFWNRPAKEHPPEITYEVEAEEVNE